MHRLWTNIKHFMHQYFITLVFAAAFILFAGFANKSVNQIRCNSLSILIRNENELAFLDRNDILKMLTEKNGKSFINQPLNEINLFVLEKFLKSNSLVDKVDLYHDLKGNIFVDLSFRKPIIRIMSAYRENYYIDENGNKMDISDKFTPKVPIVTGHTYSTASEPDFDKKLYELAKYISQDKYLSTLTGQIYVDVDKEITLVPRIGNFEIRLGKIDNLEKKFTKLKLFYEKIIPAEGWNKYKTVDLRFEKQIVVK